MVTHRHIHTLDYSFDDTSGDTSLSHFGIGSVPSYVWTVLNDIKSIQPSVKLYLCPWSPPAWMKDSNTMNGGNYLSQYNTVFANYLLKAVQAFKTQGFSVYALSLQVRFYPSIGRSILLITRAPADHFRTSL